MRDNRKVDYIVCPKCGREYLPGEIYIPRAFFGNPQEVERYSNGKIEYYSGKPMDLEETYTCDFCDTKFKVSAKVQFRVTEVGKYDMSKAYVTPLFEDKITLFEGN